MSLLSSVNSLLFALLVNDLLLKSSQVLVHLVLHYLFFLYLLFYLPYLLLYIHCTSLFLLTRLVPLLRIRRCLELFSQRFEKNLPEVAGRMAHIIGPLTTDRRPIDDR